MNGSGVPRPRMKAVALRFSLPSRCLAAAPDTNISISMPKL